MRLSTYIPTKDGRRLVRINVHSFMHEKMREGRTFLIMLSILILVVHWAVWMLT